MKTLILLLIAFLLFAGIGLAVQTAAPHAPAPAQTVSAATTPGRYQIVINPNLRADTFLLDTQDGKIWRMTKYGQLEGDPIAWEFEIRLDNGQQLNAWYSAMPKKVKSEN